MPKTMKLMMEVAGCTMPCRHCWASGTPYGAMPLTDVVWVLDEARRYCQAAGLGLYSYPMHECLTHPDAPDLLRVFREFSATEGNLPFEPLPTSGVPLALRDDWERVLGTAREIGTTTLWLAFHGIGEVHDRIANRVGAYRECLTAIERARSMGLRCGCNVLVTKEMAKDAGHVADSLREAGIEQMSWEVVHYFPTARLRKYESIRPDLDDLLPVAETIRNNTDMHKEEWENIEACCERAHVQAALANPDERDTKSDSGPERIPLVCRNNLDVHSGDAGTHGDFHGNLRTDGPQRVFDDAIQRNAPEESHYFTSETIPSLSDLAQRAGDPNGSKIHTSLPSMRWRWLDLAMKEFRRQR